MNIEEFVSNNGGIVEYSLLRASGFTVGAAQYAVNVGQLARIRRGWIASPVAPPDAVRAVRVGGSLTCTSVLQRYGVWCVKDERLHVRVGAHTSHLASPDSRAVPRTHSDAERVLVHRTLTGLTVPRRCHTDPVEIALMHAIVCHPRDYAIALCDSVLNKKLATRSRLEWLASALTARHREVIRLSYGGAQSGLETRARLRLYSLGIPYIPQAEISDVGHVDLLVGERLVVELDGKEWHSSPEAFAEDRRRDLILHERGYFVIRLTYAQAMFEWHRVERLIRAVVARRKHLWGARGRGYPA
jgi:very-short-patch-repair endonuclease